MEKNHHKIGLLNWVILLAASILAVVLARYINSAAGRTAAYILGSGFLVSIVAYFQMRLEERERLEKLEFDELVKSKSSESLFTTEADTFAAKRSREQFERFFVPAFTLLLVILQGLAIFFEWKQLVTAIPLVELRATIVVSVFGLLALVLFLFGKYSSSLARLEKQRLLRPSASYLLVSAYLCAFVAIVVGMTTWGGLSKADLITGRVFICLLGLVALEMVASLILEIYRPRVRGKTERLVYESRILGLLGQPESVFTTAAHALDYQFGFKVSETWFYRFLQKALAWIILAQVVILLISTCFVFIGVGEQGILERFGRVISQKPLEPGIHFKLPWPIDSVNRIATREVHSFNIGFIPDEKLEKEKTVLWTRPHYKEEFNMLVASSEQVATNANGQQQSVPANLLTVSIPVQYQINDINNWAYKHSNPGELLEKLATREVVQYLVGVDLIEIMSSGRLKAAHELQQRIQARADEFQLGVKVLLVGLQDIHPPVKVADAFEEVVGATQEKEAAILKAQGYAARVLPEAQAEAQKKKNDAESYRFTRVAAAEASGAQFTNYITAFNAAPSVYPQRLYLDAFVKATANARKFIVAPTNSQVFQLNLEDKIAPGLLDVTVPSAKK
jgi:HflK protein